MKLASLNSGRDGKLIVVSRDLKTYTDASHIAPTMQNALDNWAEASPQLEALYSRLNAGEVESQPFEVSAVSSPLPRAYQWLDGSAYVKHVELARKLRNAEIPETFWHDPLMYQGCSDSFLAPTEDIPFVDDKWGLDYEAEVAIITDDVPMGTSHDDASKHIKLVMIVNDISLRGLIPDELKKGFGFVHGKPASSFSPVAVTTDELGTAWKDNKVISTLCSYINGEKYGATKTHIDMTFNFSQLIAHAAKTRNLCAGTIIGSGTVSNLAENVTDGSDVGSSCLLERRALEIFADKEPTPYLKDGDHILIEALNKDGKNLFGSISQTVKKV